MAMQGCKICVGHAKWPCELKGTSMEKPLQAGLNNGVAALQFQQNFSKDPIQTQRVFQTKGLN